MSKMGNHVMEMEEDAGFMSLYDFQELYGKGSDTLRIWDRVNGTFIGRSNGTFKRSEDGYQTP